MPGRTATLPKSLRGLGGKLGQKLLGALQLEPEAPTAELQKVSLSELQRLVGEQSAAFVHRLCRGEDSDEVRAGEMKRTPRFLPARPGTTILKTHCPQTSES
eukprot:s923_g19.t1